MSFKKRSSRLKSLFRVLFLLFVFSITQNPALAEGSINPDIVEILVEILPQEKSLQNDSRFIVADDFNDGELQQSPENQWKVVTQLSGKLKLEVEREDSRNKKRGHSLKGKVELEPNGKVSWQKLVNRTDVSQAKFLIFNWKMKAKKEKVSFNKIFLSLGDGRHRMVHYDISDQYSPLASGEWKTVAVPIENFEELDLNQLLLIRFTVENGNEKNESDIWLDEIAFFGKENLSFECVRDNLMGFPQEVMNEKTRQELLIEEEDGKFLEKIAGDTWKYFDESRDDETYLIADHIRIGDNPLAANYTSTTNIGLDMMSIISAMELGLISREEAYGRVSRNLDTLLKLERHQGFFFNFYHTRTLEVTRRYVSTVDNGWLAIALVVTRQAFTGAIARKATRLLDSLSFSGFLDPENNQLVVGFEVPRKKERKFHYGIFVSEARATSFYAIGKGDVPRKHWWSLYRTPPLAWEWQNQVPKGKEVIREGVDYFQGYYEYGEQKIVPSWGGSLFEFLMPTIVMKEKSLSPNSLGLNNRIATEIHRDYALKEKGYPVWGISPAAVSNGRNWLYGEFGIKGLSVKGYPDKGIITPHVSFLALDPLPQDAIQNIRNLLKYEIYGEYGFYDSIDIEREEVNPQYLALDQGMILIAICNYLKNGAIQEYFHSDRIAKSAADLLNKESFSNS